MRLTACENDDDYQMYEKEMLSMVSLYDTTLWRQNDPTSAVSNVPRIGRSPPSEVQANRGWKIVDSAIKRRTQAQRTNAECTTHGVGGERRVSYERANFKLKLEFGVKTA